MPEQSNTPFFSMITIRMANKFPNSGTLEYHVVCSGTLDGREKSRIPIKSHILAGCIGPGHRIALSFMECDLPPCPFGKVMTVPKAASICALIRGEL